MGVQTTGGYKKAQKGGGSSGGQILFVPAAGVTVRFMVSDMSDPTGWIAYKEFWDQENRQYVIVTDDNEHLIPDGVWPSTRYLAAAIKTEDNRVVAVKLPQTLADNVAAIAERYKEKKKLELNEFDVELAKEGEGQSTTYMAIPDGVSEVDLDAYDLPDLIGILQGFVDAQASKNVEPDIDDDEDVPAPKIPLRKKK